MPIAAPVRTLVAVIALASGAFLVSPAAAGEAPGAGTYPVPSIYPKAFQFKFEHGLPTRIVVDLHDGQSPHAFWYLVYTVTNDSDQEQAFLPVLELYTKDGQAFRSDDHVKPAVFHAVAKREKNDLLESQYGIGGELRLGPDQARDGVAIWPEPSAEMGSFSIYVSGLSGEYAFLKDAAGSDVKGPDGNPVILRKSLQLNYLIRGDEVYPGEDAVNENAESWVMR